MLPGPGFVFLITLERPQGADQQARSTGWAQAHVDLIQLARVGLGRHQVNDPLAQTREKLRTVDWLGAIGFGLGITIMDKHQVQVRTMAQLETTHLTVTDDHEARITQTAVATLGLTILGHGLTPGQGQHLFQNGLGQPGQIIADLHQWQAAGNFRSRHAQAVGQLEMTQGLHLLFKIVFGDPRQALAQFGRQFRGQGRAEEAALVEQLIEQQRETGNLLGDPGAGGAQCQQTTQGTGVFREQHQVGRTPRHRLDQRQHPLQDQVGIVMLYRLGQQSRDKGIQALAPQTLHGTQLGAGTQACQLPQGLGGIDKTSLLQLPASRIFILFFFPQRQPFAADHHFAVVALFVVRVGNHLTEMPIDPAAPVHQLGMERRPIVEAQHQRNTRTVQLTVGQHLGLAIGDRLDSMFGVTQKFIAFA
ncbi:hypothetical protein D9M71_196250 [compost metagenome]